MPESTPGMLSPHWGYLGCTELIPLALLHASGLGVSMNLPPAGPSLSAQFPAHIAEKAPGCFSCVLQGSHPACQKLPAAAQPNFTSQVFAFDRQLFTSL